MHKQETSLCFSGHRDERLPQTEEELKKLREKIREAVEKAISQGVDTFYFGGCRGFDLLCADVVSVRKRVIKPNDPIRIYLICVAPYENQANRWKASDRELYYNLLSQCDEVITLHTHYKQGCYHERNRYMVDRSSTLLCYYDGGTGGTAHTVSYAKRNHLQITNLYEAESHS